MRIAVAFTACSITAFPLGAKEGEAGQAGSSGPVGYKEYAGLLGEDWHGNVFVIQYNGRLVACMSRHQFEGKAVPSRAEDDDGNPIPLDPRRVFRQDDVQLLPLKDQKEGVPFLAFRPDYELRAGEKLWIRRGTGPHRFEGTTGTLRPPGPADKPFRPEQGPRELVMDLDQPADVEGASGSPVFQVSTGLPVGVLLAADKGQGARVVVFEPICLPVLNSRRETQAGSAPPGTSLEKRLVGTWVEDFGANGKAQNTFQADGTYLGRQELKLRARTVVVTFEGKWHTEGDDVLVYTVLKCSQPNYPFLNKEIEDRILEMSDDAFTYESLDLGTRSTMRRGKL